MTNSETNAQEEIILKVVGAGISLTLFGVRLSGGRWKYLLEKDEGTMADFLPEEDADPRPTSHTRTRYVSTWEKALALLDLYLWTWLPIKEIHFDFAELVLSAIRSRRPFKNLKIES